MFDLILIITGLFTVGSVGVVCLINVCGELLLLLNFVHKFVNLLVLPSESLKDCLQSVHHSVSCHHHFGIDKLPFPIKAAEYREQFRQVESLFSAFFRRFFGRDEIRGVSAFA